MKGCASQNSNAAFREGFMEFIVSPIRSGTAYGWFLYSRTLNRANRRNCLPVFTGTTDIFSTDILSFKIQLAKIRKKSQNHSHKPCRIINNPAFFSLFTAICIILKGNQYIKYR
jgi:hypothetical protein